MRFFAVPAMFLTAFSLAASPGWSQTFESGPEQVEALELFTSEGCSSCPPADRFISSLTSDPGLFSEFVPLVFHVDYWDYIGWKDRFARQRFSERQRNYVREGLVSQVYTPGFVVNSREWRAWFRGEKRWPESESMAGNLKATLKNRTLSVDFSGEGAGQLHIAMLGMGLETQVRAGENRGRSLIHDFVVLESQSFPGESSWTVDFPTTPRRGQSGTALAIWVTPENSQRILQVTGGMIE